MAQATAKARTLSIATFSREMVAQSVTKNSTIGLTLDLSGVDLVRLQLKFNGVVFVEKTFTVEFIEAHTVKYSADQRIKIADFLKLGSQG